MTPDTARRWLIVVKTGKPHFYKSKGPRRGWFFMSPQTGEEFRCSPPVGRS